MGKGFAGGMLAVGLALMAVAAVGCRRYPPPVPLDALNEAQTHGHQVFEARCAQCHSDRTDEKKNGPALVALFKKPALPSGAAATDERVTATIERGHGVMPAMGNVVYGQDLDDVLAYLHTL